VRHQALRPGLFFLGRFPSAAVCAPANRRRWVGMLKYVARSYSSESAEESKMYIGGGVGLVVLIIILVMFLR
jgi:hypothetical protein